MVLPAWADGNPGAAPCLVPPQPAAPRTAAGGCGAWVAAGKVSTKAERAAPTLAGHTGLLGGRLPGGPILPQGKRRELGWQLVPGGLWGLSPASSSQEAAPAQGPRLSLETMQFTGTGENLQPRGELSTQGPAGCSRETATGPEPVLLPPQGHRQQPQGALGPLSPGQLGAGGVACLTHSRGQVTCSYHPSVGTASSSLRCRGRVSKPSGSLWCN